MIHLKRTLPTDDQDAKSINGLINPVLARIEAGEKFIDILTTRFNGDTALFKVWARANIDASMPTIIRSMKLYRNRESIIPAGYVSLRDCYAVLGMAGERVSLNDLLELADKPA